MTTDLTLLWNTNRRWRAWMDANTKFVTPSTLQALRHTRNETCEVADLISRQEHPEETRNNGRDSTVEQELADVVVMALTALEDPPSAEGFGTFDADYLCDNANNAVMAFRMNVPTWNRRVHWTINRILAYPGLDLPAELDRCWRRLAVKHGMTALARWLGENGLTMESIGLISFENGAGNDWPTPWQTEQPE